MMGWACPSQSMEGLGTSPVAPQEGVQCCVISPTCAELDTLHLMCSFGSVSCICLGRFVPKKPLPNLLAQKGAQNMRWQCRQSRLQRFAGAPTQPTAVGLLRVVQPHHSSVHAVFQIPTPCVFPGACSCHTETQFSHMKSFDILSLAVVHLRSLLCLLEQ